ncbi:MAG: polymer-forming cytoskeletal protein [Candidatus Margulisbacteria bacterium]|nr:polymer-forming cytoskeletal protein [Candidatus Margulisiibacteriota bacterium]
MKKILMLLLALFFIASACTAATFINGNNIIIPASKIIKGNLYVLGDKIQIYGEIQGDVYALGESIKIKGKVKGDINAAGKNLEITPLYANDLRLAGDNISTRGKIYNDIIALGRNISIKNQVISDVFVRGEVLYIASYTKIGGSLNYSADKVTISRKARIAKIIATPIKKTTCPTSTKNCFSSIAPSCNGILIINFIILMIFAGLFIKFAPNQIKLISKSILTSPLKSMGWGLATLILTPVIIVILIPTLIGIPFSIILIFFYVLMIYLSKILLGFSIGEWLIAKLNKKGSKKSKKTKGKQYHPFFVFLLGIVVYHILIVLPILGGILHFLGLILGLGALITTRFVTYAQARKKGIL